MAQWWRICLPMQETLVRSLIWEDLTCCRATKHMHHNYWAPAPQWEEPRLHKRGAPAPQWEELPLRKRGAPAPQWEETPLRKREAPAPQWEEPPLHKREAPAPQWEEPPQREACTSQLQCSPCSLQLEKSQYNSEDHTWPKKKKSWYWDLIIGKNSVPRNVICIVLYKSKHD